MIKKKLFLIILSLGIIIFGLFLYDGLDKEMVINKEFLNASEIEYIEVIRRDDGPSMNIKDSEKIVKIILLLQQLNGSVVLEHLPPSGEPMLGLHIVLKGHYPSSAIFIYHDKIILNGKGRHVSGERINEFVKTIESTY